MRRFPIPVVSTPSRPDRGIGTMPRIDLSSIISETRVFLGTRQDHVAMSGLPGYDGSLSLYNLVGSVIKLREALGNRLSDDTEAEPYFNVLRLNIGVLANGVNADDSGIDYPSMLTAVERAVEALERIEARRSKATRGEQKPTFTIGQPAPMRNSGNRADPYYASTALLSKTAALPPFSGSVAPLGPDGPSAPERIPYETLDRKIGWFKPAPPTEFFRGVERREGAYKGFWHVHRTPDGIWVCHFSFDGYRPSKRSATGQQCAHWQITPKQAEIWFVENGQAPPPILFEDLARQPPPPRGDGQDVVFASGRASPEEELALELRRRNRKIPALLVEYLVGRDVADAQDIAVAVHDHRNTPDKTISANCRRTNKAAERLGSPLRYEFKGARVFKSMRR